MKELDKIPKRKKVLLKIRIIHTMVFWITMYGCGSWIMKKGGRKKVDSLEMWWWMVLEMPQTTKKDKSVDSRSNQA